MKTIQTFALIILLFAAKTFAQDDLTSGPEVESTDSPTIGKENSDGLLAILVNGNLAAEGGDEKSTTAPILSSEPEALIPEEPESQNSDPNAPKNDEAEPTETNQESITPNIDQASQLGEQDAQKNDEPSTPIEAGEVPAAIPNADEVKAEPVAALEDVTDSTQADVAENGAVPETVSTNSPQVSETVEISENTANEAKEAESTVPNEGSEAAITVDEVAAADKEAEVADTETSHNVVTEQINQLKASATSESAGPSANEPIEEVQPEENTANGATSESVVLPENEPVETVQPEESTATDVASESAIPSENEPIEAVQPEETTATDVASESAIPSENEPIEALQPVEPTATDVNSESAVLPENNPIENEQPEEPIPTDTQAEVTNSEPGLVVEEGPVSDSPDSNPTLTASESTSEDTAATTTHVCSTTGDFANPDNCRSYISCSGNASNLLAQVNQCPDRTAFHSSLRRCSRDMSPCTEEEPTCIGTGSISIPGDNSSYYWCVQNILGGFHKYHIKCSINEIFYELFGRCILIELPPYGIFNMINTYPNDRDVVRAEWKLVKKEIKQKAKEEKIRKKMEAKAKAAAEKLAAKEQRKQMKSAGSEEDDDEEDD